MHPRGFQHLSRARGPQSTRARGGDREGGDVSRSRAKLVFCLGSQILREKPPLGTKKAKLTAIGYKSSICTTQKQISSIYGFCGL